MRYNETRVLGRLGVRTRAHRHAYAIPRVGMHVHTRVFYDINCLPWTRREYRRSCKTIVGAYCSAGEYRGSNCFFIRSNILIDSIRLRMNYSFKEEQRNPVSIGYTSALLYLDASLSGSAPSVPRLITFRSSRFSSANPLPAAICHKNTRIARVPLCRATSAFNPLEEVSRKGLIAEVNRG